MIRRVADHFRSEYSEQMQVHAAQLRTQHDRRTREFQALQQNEYSSAIARNEQAYRHRLDEVASSGARAQYELREELHDNAKRNERITFEHESLIDNATRLHTSHEEAIERARNTSLNLEVAQQNMVAMHSSGSDLLQERNRVEA